MLNNFGLSNGPSCSGSHTGLSIGITCSKSETDLNKISDTNDLVKSFQRSHRKYIKKHNVLKMEKPSIKICDCQVTVNGQHICNLIVWITLLGEKRTPDSQELDNFCHFIKQLNCNDASDLAVTITYFIFQNYRTNFSTKLDSISIINVTTCSHICKTGKILHLWYTMIRFRWEKFVG